MSSGNANFLDDFSNVSSDISTSAGAAVATVTTDNVLWHKNGNACDAALNTNYVSDLMDDSPQPAQSSIIAAPAGDLVDLLGDEVAVPAPAVENPTQTATAVEVADNATAGHHAADAVAAPEPHDVPQAPLEPPSEAPPASTPPDECPPEGELHADKHPTTDPPAPTQPHADSPAKASAEPLQSECSDVSQASAPPGDGSRASQSLPSDPGQGPDEDDASNDPDGSGSPGAVTDERLVDSDREVVEEEDAFGDFADFTTASHFLPGGAGAGSSAPLPPPSASAAAAARASGGGPSSSSSPSTHRHAHLGTAFPVRTGHGVLAGTGSQLHGGPLSGAMSDHGSFGGDFSDFSHASPAPSVAPSRAGGGRKSVASIASVGSRAGGDDDLGDYGSVVGSSVWRAPSQMATSSYAAAAGADDDFGDFTSDITSTSDFAPSTQPPSAVAVSGPGSMHPDDDFGSFASHRSTADDDEDDFGNFNAAPVAAGAGAAGPSGSGGPAGGALAPSSASTPTGACGGAAAAGGGAAPAGSTGLPLSPRDAAAAAAAGAAAAAASQPYHSTQSVGPAVGGSEPPSQPEPPLLQLPPQELRQAVSRALQPLLPAGSPLAVPLQPAAAATTVQDELVSAAWAQLRRHVHVQVQGGRVDAGAGVGAIAAHNGMPLLPASSAAGVDAGAAAGTSDALANGRVGYAPTFKFSRPLRWKGSESERRLLTSLGLNELSAQARAAEAAAAAAAEGSRGTGRGAAGAGGGVRQLGLLASFGDAPRRVRTDISTAPAGLRRDLECDTAGSSAANGASAAGGTSRARGLGPSADGPGSAGPLMEAGGGAGGGATPRTASGTN